LIAASMRLQLPEMLGHRDLHLHRNQMDLPEDRQEDQDDKDT